MAIGLLLLAGCTAGSVAGNGASDKDRHDGFYGGMIGGGLRP